MLLKESVEELRTDDAKGQELNLNGSNSGRELEGLLPQPSGRYHLAATSLAFSIYRSWFLSPRSAITRRMPAGADCSLIRSITGIEDTLTG